MTVLHVLLAGVGLLAATAAAAQGGDVRRSYTVTVEWQGEMPSDALATAFRTHLGECGQVVIAPNEEERKRIIREIEANLIDLVSRKTRVEIGEMTGWDFTIELRRFALPSGGERFAAKVLDLARGEVADVTVPMPREAEGAAEHLAHEVCRKLPPRAGVRQLRERYQKAVLDVGRDEGIHEGQELTKTVNRVVTARLRVVSARASESEADVVSGWEHLREGDGLTVAVPDIPPDKVCPLYIFAPPEFSVSVDGEPRGQSKGGYAALRLWPGRHEVEIAGSVRHVETVHVGPSGKEIRLRPEARSQARTLTVHSDVPGIVRKRQPGARDWDQLGQTGVAYTLPPKRYEVRVVAAGHLPWTQTVDLTDRPQTVTADLRASTGMVPVPGGTVRLGHPTVTGRPPREVRLAAYLMDAREVTAREFRAFEARHRTPRGWPDEAPAIPVGWEQAKAYCESQGKRLPSEDEWERACRGPGGQRYGYGESYDPMQSDARPEGRADAHPERDKPPNGYGLFDMTGSVWEWCGQTADLPGNQRVLRGGAWRMLDPAERADCVHRLVLPADKKGAVPFGFRCAADAE